MGKKYDTVLEMYRKAIEINPESYRTYFQLGLYNEHFKMYDRAVKMYKRAIELNSKDKVSFFGLVSAYKHLGRYDRAEEILKKAIEKNSGNDWMYGTLALLYEELGKYDLAKEYFKKTNKFRLENYNSIIQQNYQRLKEIVTQKEIKLVCVQYPLRSVESLKKMFKNKEGIIFVDNEGVFKEALKQASYDEYFADIFVGDFGHCYPKGNKLLAENIANVILKGCFNNGK